MRNTRDQRRLCAQAPAGTARGTPGFENPFAFTKWAGRHTPDVSVGGAVVAVPLRLPSPKGRTAVHDSDPVTEGRNSPRRPTGVMLGVVAVAVPVPAGHGGCRGEASADAKDVTWVWAPEPSETRGDGCPPTGDWSCVWAQAGTVRGTSGSSSREYPETDQKDGYVLHQCHH